MATIFDSQPKPRKGDFLLAEPFMWDPNFKRSVIMLCEHNEEGTFGLVINRPIDLMLGDVLPELSFFEAQLHYGGPCDQNTLHYLHRCSRHVPDCVNLGNGIFWGGDFEIIKEEMIHGNIKPEDIRFYVGYSGWEGQQLSVELSDHSWIVTEGASGYLFEDAADGLWRAVLSDMGGEYRLLANYPEDVAFN